MADKPKTYCYQSANYCDIVRAGFHITQFWVCRSCKQEVTEELAEYRLELKGASDDWDGSLWGINLDGDD